MTTLLYVVFIFSGAAGLMYESIWSRYLGLFAGHSAYAQIIVLTIFLGGMSLGALLAGECSERLREPLVAYAAVEALAGILGIFFHDIFIAVTRFAYDSVFPALAGSGALLVVKWTIAGLLILPQSVLLGMTFPLMSAGVLRLASARPGHVLALLYFANSLGAALGVLVAGFYLIAIAGLPGTLLAAGSINLAVALATFFGVRVIRPPQVPAYTSAPPSAPASVPAAPDARARRRPMAHGLRGAGHPPRLPGVVPLDAGAAGGAPAVEPGVRDLHRR